MILKMNDVLETKQFSRKEMQEIAALVIGQLARKQSRA